MSMELPLESSPMFFAETVLELPLYAWQDIALTWFLEAAIRRVKGTVCTPNGAGKSERVVAPLVLYWLSMYPRGKVVVTTKSGLQLDSQIMPAIRKHAAKFEGWRFNEREVRTPTGGLGVFFTTDEETRAEGHHPTEDGPLLIIVDEAKSVPEGIFQALDRCTYSALLYVSSPGPMAGRFYDSQTKPELGFKKLSIGLKDCPHIPQERIDDIIRTYGSNSPYTRSTLHGEFMSLHSGDPVFYAFQRDYHEQKELGWPHGATMIVSADVGTHNATVISAFIRKGGHDYFWTLREIVLTGSDTDRQMVRLLQVLAADFPFWNAEDERCPACLFFCDPAARNSAFTARGPTSSALAVMHTHGLNFGYRVNQGLQPTIAVCNRLLQNNHQIEIKEDGKPKLKTIWHFKIDPDQCPTLVEALRGQYAYPEIGDSGYGNDKPKKGDLCGHIDHVADGWRYGVINTLALAEESYDEMKTAKYTRRTPAEVEMDRTI